MTAFMNKHPYILLGILSILLFLAGNDILAITDTAESNYALTAKEMVLSGNWVSPQIYGNYWYDKPIFYYWEVALSFLVFGFNEFAARFPSALFGTVNILFIYWFTNRVYGRKAAWLAALILGTSVETGVLSKAVITDATLFFFLSASLASFYLGYTEKKAWYYGAYIFAALATLTKGPIGLFLPSLAALLFLVYKKDLKEMLHVHLITGMALFLVIAGSWYGAMYAMHGSDFILNFFGVHNVLRATVPEHASKNVWYFYFIIYFAGFFPWSFVLPYRLFKCRKQHVRPFAKGDDCAALLLIYAAVIFLFFSLVATKYTTYTYPMVFSLAILTARLCETITLPVQRSAAAIGTIYIVLAMFVAPAITLNNSGKEVGQALQYLPTENTTVCFFHDYRTSAVFYSGRTIYFAVPEKDIDNMRPGGMNWNAKNVMPMITQGEALKKDNCILITPKKKYSDAEAVIQSFNRNVDSVITLAGNYDILIMPLS